jgi:hypothetical protein
MEPQFVLAQMVMQSLSPHARPVRARRRLPVVRLRIPFPTHRRAHVPVRMAEWRG